MTLEVIALYAAVVGVVGGVMWWSRSDVAARISARTAILLATSATLAGLFVQLPERQGETLIKISLDPLRGLKQALLMPTGAIEPVFAQAWSIGNLFVLWPLAIVLIVNAGWTRMRVFVTCAAFIVVCELLQGSVPMLRRAFELADIISNVGGVLILFLVLRALRVDSRQ